jgi:hypothetical protein
MVVPSIDPDVITVGGWWAPFTADIEAAFRDNRPDLGGGALAKIPRIAPAAAGRDAGLGAARQARERLRSALVSTSS